MIATRAARRLDHFQPTAAKPTGSPVSARATSSIPSASSAVAISARAISAQAVVRRLHLVELAVVAHQRQQRRPTSSARAASITTQGMEARPAGIRSLRGIRR